MSDADGRELPPFMDEGGLWLAVRVALLALLAALLYVGRPLVHGLVYRTAFSPAVFLLLGVPIAVAVVLFLVGPLRGFRPRTYIAVLTLVVILSILLAILVGVPAAMVEERTLATETMDEAAELDTFPAVNADNPRITPRQVADVQTSGSVSYRQHSLGRSDIARMPDGRLSWSYAITPEDLRNRIYEHQRGVAMSDMTRMSDRELFVLDEQEFAIGQGMFLHRGAEWNLKKTDFWAQYRDDPIEFVHDGQAYMAYPKTGHEWRVDLLGGFLPIPYTIPVWDGVALLHTDGTIEHLDPSEAQANAILEGQRLYPLYNTYREVDALGYREGIVNQWPLVGAHEGEVEIASLPAGAGNAQPFVIDMADERMSYVVAMEPYGAETRGLDEVWFADARTGEYRFFGTERETLLGPERAMGLVRSEDTRTNWGSNFEVIEPVPVVVDEELWWHSKVVPTDYTDVSRNVFVNAHTQDAVEIRDTESVIEFLEGEDVGEEIGSGVEPAPGEENVSYYLVIYDEHGEEVDRIPVGPDEEVRIEADEED